MRKVIDKYYVLPILSYTALFVAVYLALYVAGVIKTLPNSYSLLHWDATYYRSIADEGYVYKKGQACNVGFFPLFPYLWKVTLFNAFWISVLNGAIYLSALAFLAGILKPDKILLGFFMASPFMFFMFTPLSEPLFFLSATIILYGIVNDNNRYIFTGVLLASLTRASFLFLVPAFVGMALMSNPVNNFFDVTLWRKILLVYILPCAVGLLIVLLIQLAQTDMFFGYFIVQSTAWGRKFSLPVFPIGRDSIAWVNRASYFSFWVGMFASLISLKYLAQWLLHKPILQNLKKHEIFALIFISMSLVSIVFFNPKWNWVGYNATSLPGINRYINAVPFLLIFIMYLFRGVSKSPVYLAGLFIFTYGVWFCVSPHYYHSMSTFREVSIVTLFLLPYWAYYYLRWKPLGYAIILVSFIAQSILYSYCLSGIFVD